MARPIEFYFDVGSPAAYLASTQLPAIASRTGAEIVWRPVLLGGVFQATGNVSPLVIEAKGRYLLDDFGRFARRYGVPLRFSEHFPFNTLQLMRGAVVAERDGFLAPYLDAIFRGLFVEGRDMSDLSEVAILLRATPGVEADRVLAGSAEQSVKDTLKANTDAAVARGVFGIPIFFVGEQMFFGQDRLDFVEEAAA